MDGGSSVGCGGWTETGRELAQEEGAAVMGLVSQPRGSSGPAEQQEANEGSWLGRGARAGGPWSSRRAREGRPLLRGRGTTTGSHPPSPAPAQANASLPGSPASGPPLNSGFPPRVASWPHGRLRSGPSALPALESCPVASTRARCSPRGWGPPAPSEPSSRPQTWLAPGTQKDLPNE